MQMLNKLLGSGFILATGFALGLGAANYFAAADNEGKKIASAATTKLPETALSVDAIEKAEINVLSATLTTPTKPTANIVVSNMLSEDITLTETVVASRQETAISEPSPEELAYNPPDHAVTTPLGLHETDELENTLRLESENTVRNQVEGEAGLLAHEAL